MKALKAIGFRKACAYVFYWMVSKMLHWIILPQLRVFMLRVFGARIGQDTIIGDITYANLYHYGFSKLSVGNRCFIGDEAMLDVRGGITLEDNVTISNRTIVVTHINVGYDNHPLQKAYPMREQRVIFRKGSYIGTAALLLPGVVIGQEAVVGAGSVVTRDVKARTVVAGTPAKKIKSI